MFVERQDIFTRFTYSRAGTPQFLSSTSSSTHLIVIFTHHTLAHKTPSSHREDGIQLYIRTGFYRRSPLGTLSILRGSSTHDAFSKNVSTSSYTYQYYKRSKGTATYKMLQPVRKVHPSSIQPLTSNDQSLLTANSFYL